MSGFDLTQFDDAKAKQERGVVVELVHPATGEPLGAWIRVAGPDSTLAKKAEHDLIDRRTSGRGRLRKLTAEQLQEEARRKLAFCTMEWNGIEDGGERVPCVFDEILSVYERAPWIMEQVAEAAGDRAEFFRRSDEGVENNSSSTIGSAED